MLQKTESKLLSFHDMSNLAKAFKDSGYFKDVESQNQALVKILAGQEVGLPAFASMTGISIIQGKPVLGANSIATLIANNPSYDYEIVEATNTNCEIDFFKILNGKKSKSGSVSFNETDARNAGLLSKDIWKKYPSDMYFARAISRGARRFCPGIFGGAPVYTAEELGVDMDEEGYPVIPPKDITPLKPEVISPEINEEESLEIATLKDHFVEMIKLADTLEIAREKAQEGWSSLKKFNNTNAGIEAMRMLQEATKSRPDYVTRDNNLPKNNME